MYSELYNVQCVVYSLHCTVNCTMYIVQCVVYCSSGQVRQGAGPGQPQGLGIPLGVRERRREQGGGGSRRRREEEGGGLREDGDEGVQGNPRVLVKDRGSVGDGERTSEVSGGAAETM